MPKKYEEREEQQGIIVRRRVIEDYLCPTCETRYSRISQARACAARPIEVPGFAVGDRVASICDAICNHDHPRNWKSFHPEGTIVEITRLLPMDGDESARQLDGALSGMHVHQYRMAYHCLCGKERRQQFYSVQLVATGGLTESR